jgi:L-lactate dehydrogenase complex protein LldG
MATDAPATGAREDVLRRIRRALGRTASESEATSGWYAIDRGYRRTGSLERGAVIEELEDRLRDYDANVVQSTQAELTATISELLAARGVRTLVVPHGLVEAIGVDLPRGFEFVEDNGLTASELDRLDGVITGCTVAISQTGTLILQTVAGQGRRAPTLVPDYHLCLVKAQDVVETVSEAIGRLEPTASLATTFVSGPSATADIEMTRIKGVHGPRFLDVIVIA